MIRYKYSTFSIITLGCKVNQYESDAIASQLLTLGINFNESNKNSDLCIINTCTVTQKASMQCRQAIRQIIRNNPKALILVTGCYAQTEAEELQKIDGIHYIVTNKEKYNIKELISQKQPKSTEIIGDNFNNKKFVLPDLTVTTTRTRSVLKIQDGCNAFCSYCIVPYARGRSRSMPLNDVLENIKDINKKGFKEIILSGIHVGCYGLDLTPKTNLYTLLSAIDSQKLIPRLRISSIEPHEITDDIIELAASSETICDHFHIPLQSGDDDILQKMNRPYNSIFFNELIFKIKDKIKNAAIGVDVLVGFPAETDKAFENTFLLLEKLPISYLHVFPFSARKKTKAYDMSEKVPIDVIKHRCAKLRKLSNEKKSEFYKSFLNKNIKVLIENKRDKKTNLLKAVSSNYLKVFIDGKDEFKNKIKSVKINNIDEDNIAYAKLLKIC